MGCKIPSFIPPENEPENGRSFTFVVTDENDTDILKAIEARTGLVMRIETASPDKMMKKKLPVKHNLTNLKTLTDIFWEQKTKLKTMEERLDKQLKDIANAKDKMIFSVAQIDKMFV